MTEASWLADPTGRHELRYWDGTAWTDHVSDQGVTGLDPLAAAAPTPTPAPDQPAAPAEPWAGAQDPNATAAWPAGPPSSYPSGAPAGPSYDQSPASYATAGATPSGGGAPVGVIVGVIALVALLAVGGWFLFLRDDGDDDTVDPATDVTTTTTGDESGTTTSSPGASTSSSTPGTQTAGDGEGAGEFDVAIPAGGAYRHTVTLGADEAVRVRAASPSGGDVVISFVLPEDEAIEWYRTASELAPGSFYASPSDSDEVVLDYLFPPSGFEPEAGEAVLDYEDVSFSDPEAMFLVTHTAGTFQIAISEYEGLPADATIVIETKPGVDFAEAYTSGTDPFLTGPFYDGGGTSPTLPTSSTLPGGPNVPSGPPGAGGDIADLIYQQLVDGGMTEAQATCIVDGLTEQLGDLTSMSNPTPEQTEALTELTIECISGG